MRYRRLAVSTALLLAGIIPAVADVPVSDEQRLNQETSIAKCMEKARSYKDETLTPTKGIQGSVASPGQGGQVADVGRAGVSGATAGGSSGAGFAGQDFGSIVGGDPTATSLRVENFGQVLSASQQVSGAMTGNSQALQAIAQAIGSVSGLQAGFDQNSGVRVNQAGIWNQAVQIANTLASLRNMELLRQTASASASQSFIKYDKDQGFIVKSETPQADPGNTETTGTATTSQAEISAALQQMQDAVNSPVTATGSINGQ